MEYIFHTNKLRLVLSDIYLIIPFIAGLALLPEQAIFGIIVLTLCSIGIFHDVHHRNDNVSIRRDKITIESGNKSEEYIWQDINKYHIHHHGGKHPSRKLYIITKDNIEHIYNITYLECTDDEFNGAWINTINSYNTEVKEGSSNHERFAIHDIEIEEKERKNSILLFIAFIIIIIIVFLICQ